MFGTVECQWRLSGSKECMVKAFGGFVLVAAAVVGGYALLFFDTSVSTGFGTTRVHNLGLMQDRQNLLIAACAAAVVGTLMLLLGGSNSGAVETTLGTARESGPEANLAFHVDTTIETRAAIEAVRDALAKDDSEALSRVLAAGSVRGYGEFPTGRGFLQFAVASNAFKCIPVLMAGGAEAHQRDSTGMTARQMVSLEDTLPIVKALLDGAQLEPPPKWSGA